MGRELKRVPIDFDWPQGKIWPGYMNPYEYDVNDKWGMYIYENWKRIDPPEGSGYQLWETVTEGSPISPVFINEKSFKMYLSGQGYSDKAVDVFLEKGHAFSMVAVRHSKGVDIAPDIEGLPLICDDDSDETP